MNKDGDKVDGVVYLNMDRGGCHRTYLMDGKFEMYMKEVTIRDIFGWGEGHEILKKA